MIFSEQLLVQLQTIRNFQTNITAVACSKNNGMIAIFCENMVTLYKPFFNKQSASLIWEFLSEHLI